MSDVKRVTMTRHRTVRMHSTWTADVPMAILNDSEYFDEEGDATAKFDQWMCDNGQEANIDYSEPDDHEDDDLAYQVENVETLIPVEADAQRVLAALPKNAETIPFGDLQRKLGVPNGDRAAQLRATLVDLQHFGQAELHSGFGWYAVAQ